MSKFNKLSRTEMKNVLGGYVMPPVNPNCAGTSGTSDYYCCGAKSTSHIGETTCIDASARCNGSMITNDPERCN